MRSGIKRESETSALQFLPNQVRSTKLSAKNVTAATSIDFGRKKSRRRVSRKFQNQKTKAAANAKKWRIAVSLQVIMSAAHAPASAGCMKEFPLHVRQPDRINPKVAATKR